MFLFVCLFVLKALANRLTDVYPLHCNFAWVLGSFMAILEKVTTTIPGEIAPNKIIMFLQKTFSLKLKVGGRLHSPLSAPLD